MPTHYLDKTPNDPWFLQGDLKRTVTLESWITQNLSQENLIGLFKTT
jgi:hypothetical protein